MSARLQTMKSTDKPERVLKVFRSYGFDDTQISRIVRRQPSLLLADPDKSLKPKFEVFTSVGASHDRIVEIISKCPGILRRSVENGRVPMFDLLKSSIGSNEGILTFLARAITEDNWEKKAEIYRKWGWSESEFLTAFKKQPKIMLVSEKKMEGIMTFLVYEMGVEPYDIARLPNALLYSLENRIVPRCSVIQLCISKCLIEIKDCNILVALMISEEQFLKLYVKKHKENLTELMEIYSTKASGEVTSNAK